MADLYIGGSRVPGIVGDRCHSAVAPVRTCDIARNQRVLLDSGAFSDKPEKRLTFAGALERQLEWESRARALWSMPDFQIGIVASYDFLLIDEVWEDGARRKKRWPEWMGGSAVEVSIKAAEYLASCRDQLGTRTLLHGCQGASADQYIECAKGILAIADRQDWFGFGGRCILGRQKSLLQEHYETALAIIPLVAAKGLKHVHIFGVLYEPAIAPLQWLCDRHGIELSTDSAAPVLTVMRKDHKKAGVRVPTIQGNVAWWKHHIANIQSSKWYKDPAQLIKPKQLTLFSLSA